MIVTVGREDLGEDVLDDVLGILDVTHQAERVSHESIRVVLDQSGELGRRRRPGAMPGIPGSGFVHRHHGAPEPLAFGSLRRYRVHRESSYLP